ncbi:MAG TPA: PilZ domain-containing protein [Myxococcota bacterium]
MIKPAESKRRHERFDADIPCRVTVPSTKKGGDPKFEAFLRVKDLSFGGVFVKSDFHFKGDPQIHIELKLPGEDLPVKGRVVRKADGGMGIAFEELDTKARALLLKYFVPEAHRQFHQTMKKLMPEMGLDRVSLLIHLWEEWRR